MQREIQHFTTTEGYRMEYTIVGQGEPILVMHGGHSNCMEELGYEELVERGYAIITPSRPGYGKTVKELGRTVAAACTAYAELLDKLGIHEVNLIAISAGGPSGILFASLYPQRVRSLTLQSAVADTWLTADHTLYKTARLMFRPPVEACVWAMIRLMNKICPDMLFRRMLASFSTLPSEPILRQTSGLDRIQFKRMLDRQRSGHGFLIDLVQAGCDLTRNLAAIQCPTLILHSVRDASVPVRHARHAQLHIPNAQLCELDSWGHLIWLGEESGVMYRELLRFLDSCNAIAVENESPRGKT